MSSSREPSPDWLREFQTPTLAATALTSSSNSDSLPIGTLVRKEKAVVTLSDEEETSKRTPKKSPASRRKKPKQDDLESEEKQTDTHPLKNGTVNATDPSDFRMEGEDDEMPHIREEPTGKKRESKGGSSLPLVFGDKVHRSKVLLECDGEDLDLSGDVGAVGRLVVTKSSAKEHDILLDLKGTIYKSMIIPSTTFCLVNFGPTEAKVEAVMNDFVRLQPHSNVYETETVVEGTLDGFLFESDDEADRVNTTAPAVEGEQTEKMNTGVIKQVKSSQKVLTGQKRKRADSKPTKKASKRQTASRKSAKK